MKPSLQEIANMPREAGLDALRKHYDPKWGLPLPEDHGELREFKVSIDYTLRDCEYYTVEACSAEEAEDKATAEFERAHGLDAEIEDVTAEVLQ